MRFTIYFALIILMVSCGSPSVTEELSSSQISNLIEKDARYEKIIRDLSDISYAFEEDPVLKAELSNYSYADYLSFLTLLEDSAIAGEAQKRGEAIALELFEKAKSNYSKALKDTLSAIKAIDANQFAQVTFEKYSFKQTREQYDFQRRKISRLHFKVKSKAPIKAIHIDYTLYKKSADGTYYDFDDYDDKFEINEGFKGYFSTNSKRLDEDASSLGKDFTVTSELKYEGESLGQLKSRLQVSRAYYEMSDNNKRLFAKVYGDKITTESFNSGEFKVEIKNLDIVAENGTEYRYPVQIGVPSLSYSDTYGDNELFKLLRYFFKEPSSSAPVFDKVGYWACFDSYYSHVNKSDFYSNTLNDYIVDTYGLDEYLNYLEKENSLGIKLKFSISRYTDISPLERLLKNK